MVQSASYRYIVDYLCKFPRIRLCPVYFIANFAGAIYEDSLLLLDDRAGKFHFTWSSKLLGLTLSIWVKPIPFHEVQQVFGPQVWARTFPLPTIAPHDLHVVNVEVGIVV